MFFTIKLYLHLNCVFILNWIVWNRTIFIKMDLALNDLKRLICHKTQITNQPTNQVSRTPLSILVDLSNDVVWMISTRPLIFKSSSPCTNPLVTVPRATITIGINVTFMFHRFFNFLARSRFVSFFLLSVSFILWSAGTAKFTNVQILFSVDYYKVWSSGRD